MVQLDAGRRRQLADRGGNCRTITPNELVCRRPMIELLIATQRCADILGNFMTEQ